ncbi:LOW QUALITY PROTEIN: hypothetical protein U9M48_013504 [Paspalum notatum var. saurae]|uniref:Reverse transcriptase domain-containing protein n=1 Tax=Paspalum notatum var. saurae TaxID=547442 RepID=A0AAQ3WJS4_PASNO
MICDWGARTLQFQEDQQMVKLQGIILGPPEISSITGEQFYKWLCGNDVWALAVVALETESSLVTSLVPPEDIFQDYHTLPPSRVYDHNIPLLPHAVPINCKPYRYSPLHKSEIQRQRSITSWSDYTQSSPFASPVLLVQKKDGSWRMCVDYRKLNDLTIINRFPLSIIEEILDDLGPAKYFTKLDMRSGYHQVRMNPEDEHKTTFKTHHGHYQFKVMPFGLTNAPATFQ